MEALQKLLDIKETKLELIYTRHGDEFANRLHTR